MSEDSRSLFRDVQLGNLPCAEECYAAIKDCNEVISRYESAISYRGMVAGAQRKAASSRTNSRLCSDIFLVVW